MEFSVINLFNCIDKALDTYSNYDNVLLAVDFNAKDDEMVNLVKVGTCFKNSCKPTFIDLFLATKNVHFLSNSTLNLLMNIYKIFYLRKQINTCKQFEDTFLSVLNMHAPLKKK